MFTVLIPVPSTGPDTQQVLHKYLLNKRMKTKIQIALTKTKTKNRLEDPVKKWIFQQSLEEWNGPFKECPMQRKNMFNAGTGLGTQGPGRGQLGWRQ